MAVEGITIPITFEGGRAGTLTLDELAERLGVAGRQADQFANAQRRSINEGIQLTQRVAGAGREIAEFGRRIHSVAVQEMGTLIARTGESISHFAQLGSALGPQGAIVGGIVGALVPAFDTLIERIQTADRNSETYRQHLESLNREMRTALERQRELEDVRAGVFGSDTSDDRLIDLRNQATTRLNDLLRDQSRLQASIERSRRQGVIVEADPAIAEGIADTRRELEGLNAEIERREEAGRDRNRVAEVAEAAGRQAEVEHDLEEQRRAAQAAAEERWRREEEHWNRLQEAVDQVAEREEAWREQQKAAADIDHVYLGQEEARKREAAAEQLRIDGETNDRMRQRAEERRRFQEQQDEELISSKEAHAQRAEESVRGVGELVGSTTGLLTDALTEVLSGTKSADDAFKGLLRSFLSMIAEQSALRAAQEFAEAIAAAASYRWDSFAQHTAAGVAFTAVAVATGVGAAALAPPPQAQRPAEPQGNGAGGQARGDVNVYISSPVISAATHAQLGRALRQQIERAGRLGL